MTCDRCYQPASLGEHGIGLCPMEKRRNASAVESVTWPGGKVFENLGNTTQTFYSRSEYQRYLKTHRIEEFVRHVPVPGSDRSPHTTSWAAVSQTTLDGAKAMLERVGTPTKTEPRTWIQSMTVTVSDVPGFIAESIAGVHAR